MQPERWIVIPHWDGPDGFQHYKDRDPIWIKSYTRLLSDEAFLTLTYHQRGLLLSIWLEYARSNRQLRDRHATTTRQTRDSHSALTRQLGHRVTTRDLEALNHAGFIEFSASKPLATRYQVASPEKRREEPPKSPFGKSPKSNGHTHVCGINGCTVTHPTEQRIREHRENVHDHLDEPTPAHAITTTAADLADLTYLNSIRPDENDA